MQDKLNDIRQAVRQRLDKASQSSHIEELRVSVLGRKGELTALLKGMSKLSPEERPVVGQKVNALRSEIEDWIDERSRELAAREEEERLKKETLDISIPGDPVPMGCEHPLSSTLERIIDIFVGMGFSVAEGPEVEQDKYNFELLNLPKNHPARDAQDTFYFNENLLLRTHTSPVQARTMLSQKPPIRVICPGRVYRADEVDATHSPVFSQCEGLVIDKGITMANLKGTLDAFAHQMYGEGIRTRFRPSFFPFTEPSAEVDVTCAACKGEGCRMCWRCAASIRTSTPALPSASASSASPTSSTTCPICVCCLKMTCVSWRSSEKGGCKRCSYRFRGLKNMSRSTCRSRNSSAA